ncbi:MAG: YhjD/YihY/BrkB family envelope integrity protein [Humidesulfovibrio sp.]
MGKLSTVKGRVVRHFRQDIWSRDLGSLAGWRQRAYALSRMVYMVVTGFLADHCIIRASALTFTTILSIVPFLAVAFSISKGFGLQNAEFFRNFLMGVSAGRAEVVDKILQYIGNTNVKTLGWMGVGALLLTVFTTVGNVERAFNTIWAVKKGRTNWRKFTDFFSIIVICPLVVLIAASFTVAVQKTGLVHAFIANPAYDWLEKQLLKGLSLALVWVGFTFAYAFIPNTRVKLGAAAVGGVVAGTMWQLAQWAYINWQIGFTKYNAIYGSFAQLPLFLVWLYISWVLVLLGAEISFAAQRLHAYVRRGLAESISPLSRQKTAMLALAHLAGRFQAGLAPQSLSECSQALRLPEDLLASVLGTLTGAGMTVETGDEETRGFGLAVSPELIRVADVARAVLECGDGDDCDVFMVDAGRVDALFAAFGQAVSGSAANVTLAEFVRLEAEALRAGKDVSGGGN